MAIPRYAPGRFSAATAVRPHDDGRPRPESLWSSRFGTTQMFPAGVALFSQHDVVDGVFLLHEGLIKLVHCDQDGNERILGLKTAPSLIGVSFVLAHGRSPVSAVALSSCKVSWMSSRDFTALVVSDPRLSWAIHQTQSREVRTQFQRLAELSSASARERLGRLLRLLITVSAAHVTAKSVRLNLPLKHREIAQLIAVTPEHLSRLFKVLQLEGVVSFAKGWLVIGDVDRLTTSTDDCESEVELGDATLAQ